MKGSKKRRGRPPKPGDERRSKNRTFRVRGLMDEYLIGHAHEAGRSVSEEIEARLERSFYMDGILLTYAGDAQPLLSAIATAVGLSFLTGPGGLDRYRVMQAATGYIIAAFGSKDTATGHAREKVLDMRWPPLNGKPEGHELHGLITALWVLSNLDPERLANQIADINEILETDRRPLTLSEELYQMAEEAYLQGRIAEGDRLRRMAQTQRQSKGGKS